MCSNRCGVSAVSGGNDLLRVLIVGARWSSASPRRSSAPVDNRGPILTARSTQDAVRRTLAHDPLVTPWET
jgi:hypothetical protein